MVQWQEYWYLYIYTNILKLKHEYICNPGIMQSFCIFTTQLLWGWTWNPYPSSPPSWIPRGHVGIPFDFPIASVTSVRIKGNLGETYPHTRSPNSHKEGFQISQLQWFSSPKKNINQLGALFLWLKCVHYVSFRWERYRLQLCEVSIPSWEMLQKPKASWILLRIWEYVIIYHIYLATWLLGCFFLETQHLTWHSNSKLVAP